MRTARPGVASRLWRQLIGRPAAHYAAAYVAAWAIFGGMFCAISNQFYNGVAQYDPRFMAQRLALERALAREVVSPFATLLQSNYPTAPVPELPSVTIRHPFPGDDRVDFEAFGAFSGPVRTKSGVVLVEVRLELEPPGYLYNLQGAPIGAGIAVRLMNAQIIDGHSVDLLGRWDDSEVMQGIMSTVGFELKHDGALKLLPINASLRDSIQHYIDASNGVFAGSQISWPQMFYVSAVTITTTGFGDIVPVGDQGRIAVGLEAMLGIILIGLFLNASAREAMYKTRIARDTPSKSL
jgi:hypothetical protein